MRQITKIRRLAIDATPPASFCEYLGSCKSRDDKQSKTARAPKYKKMKANLQDRHKITTFSAMSRCAIKTNVTDGLESKQYHVAMCEPQQQQQLTFYQLAEVNVPS